MVVAPPHESATPVMLMALLFIVMMRYLSEVPDGCEERLTAVSPYKLLPSSSVVPICASVVVAHVVPPSRETAAAMSVFKVNAAVEVAVMNICAVEGEEVAVKAFERRVAPVVGV